MFNKFSKILQVLGLEDMDKKILISIILIILSIIIITIGVIISVFTSSEEFYKVTFNTLGGTEIKEQNVIKGNLVKRPSDPLKDGYIFLEWQYNGTTFDFNTIIQSDIILKAKWQELNDNAVIVRFDTDGGSTVTVQIIEKGKKITRPTDPIKEGYIFKGWTFNNVEFDFNSEVNENIILKAIWEKIGNTQEETTYNNNFNSDTNNTNTSNKNTNNTNENNQNTNVGNNTNNKKKVKYTVTFNTDGGDTVASQIVVEGSKAFKPVNPEKEGYVFAGWELNGNSYDFSSRVISNLTLNAKWIKQKPNLEGPLSVANVNDIKYTLVLTEVPNAEIEIYNSSSLNGDYNYAKTISVSEYNNSKIIVYALAGKPQYYKVRLKSGDIYSSFSNTIEVKNRQTELTKKIININDTSEGTIYTAQVDGQGDIEVYKSKTKYNDGQYNLLSRIDEETYKQQGGFDIYRYKSDDLICDPSCDTLFQYRIRLYKQFGNVTLYSVYTDEFVLLS